MNWRLFAIGKPKLAFASAGIEEYAGRLRPWAPFQIEYMKPSGDESGSLLKRSEGMFRVVLDERGEQVSSVELARKIDAWEGRSIKSVAVLIGGADGHSATLRDSADWIWSLSRLTLQHELALVVVLEQIYRAYSIKNGTPYHRP